MAQWLTAQLTPPIEGLKAYSSLNRTGTARATGDGRRSFAWRDPLITSGSGELGSIIEGDGTPNRLGQGGKGAAKGSAGGHDGVAWQGAQGQRGPAFAKCEQLAPSRAEPREIARPMTLDIESRGLG